MSRRILEIACFNLGSAIIAEEAGADRIELCANYWEGGITPSRRVITETRERIKIPLHVIIRCRAGDYTYSTAEIEEMCSAVQFCRETKIDGIVIGLLNEDGDLDSEGCRQLLSQVGNMSVTFHRAIDHCREKDRSIENLIGLGIHRVLSSGGASGALEGVGELKRLHEKFGAKIIIMPGGGVRSEHLPKLIETGCREFHSSALTDNTATVNAAEVKKLRRLLNS
jgi:copper homeostasis protein